MIKLKPTEVAELYNLSPKLKRLLKEHGIEVVDEDRKISVVIKRVKIDE